MIDLDKLEKLEKAATAGEWSAKNWRICALNPFAYILDIATNKAARNKQNADNAAFIAAARNALPALIAELRTLREENAELKRNLLEVK